MGIGNYGQRTETMIDSAVTYKGGQYFMKADDSGESYYVYKLKEDGALFKAHLNVKKGTILELTCEEGYLGVKCFDSNGNEDGFMKLPL